MRDGRREARRTHAPPPPPSASRRHAHCMCMYWFCMTLHHHQQLHDNSLLSLTQLTAHPMQHQQQYQHCVAPSPRMQTPVHAQVRPSRLQPSSNDYRNASRSVPLPNPEDKDVPSEIEPPHAMSAKAVREQSAASPGGALTRPRTPLSSGSGRLETPEIIGGERLDHWAPNRCLGCSSEPPQPSTTTIAIRQPTDTHLSIPLHPGRGPGA